MPHTAPGPQLGGPWASVASRGRVGAVGPSSGVGSAWEAWVLPPACLCLQPGPSVLGPMWALGRERAHDWVKLCQPPFHGVTCS